MNVSDWSLAHSESAAADQRQSGRNAAAASARCIAAAAARRCVQVYTNPRSAAYLRRDACCCCGGAHLVWQWIEIDEDSTSLLLLSACRLPLNPVHALQRRGAVVSDFAITPEGRVQRHNECCMPTDGRGLRRATTTSRSLALQLLIKLVLRVDSNFAVPVVRGWRPVRPVRDLRRRSAIVIATRLVLHDCAITFQLQSAVAAAATQSCYDAARQRGIAISLQGGCQNFSAAGKLQSACRPICAQH